MTLPILNADDYAMTDGVSRSIEALAYGRRLSATSAMTTMPEWPSAAARLRLFRDRMAIGLHLNLTLGAPAGSMPRLAPGGAFPSLKTLMQQALLHHLAPDEIRAEIARQFDAFERYLGFPPDHVDGHQHVQVLPVIRQALLDEVQARYKMRPPLLRDPSDAVSQLRARGLAGAKAVSVKMLAAGFARSARARGLATNGRFAGFSAFDTAASYQTEIETELAACKSFGQGLAIIMCHPGYPDAALAALDPVVQRRQQEHDALMQLPALPDRIWHADRAIDGAALDWPALALNAEARVR